MTLVSLVTATPMTAQTGNDILLVDQAIRDAIGLVGTTDIDAIQGKVNSVILKIGNTTTAGSILKLLSDLFGGLGASNSSAAASPSSNSTAIGFLKLISSYLRSIAGVSTNCTKATVALTANTSTLAIASGAKYNWGIFNHSSQELWIEYGAAAVLSTGFNLPGRTAWLDPHQFIGAVNLISAQAVSVDYRIFT